MLFCLHGGGDNVANRLTNKQKAFIDAYCGQAKMNATEAARMAGYKHPNNSGPENLLKLGKYIQKRMEKLKERSGNSIADQQEIMEYFTALGRGEIKEKLLANDGSVVEVPVRAQDRTKGYENLAKAYGTFNNTSLAKLQQRKLKAETELTEEKVKAAKQLTGDDNHKLNELLDQIEEGVMNGTTEPADK